MSWYIELLKEEIGYNEINHMPLEKHNTPIDFRVLEKHDAPVNIDNLTSHQLHEASVNKLKELKLAWGQ